MMEQTVKKVEPSVSFDTLLSVIRKSGKEFDLEMIRRAYEFAEKAHSGQMRRSGEPYIVHPISVACIVVELGMDSESIAAALLHDVVEDTDTTLAQIQKEFGGSIAELIDGGGFLLQLLVDGEEMHHFLDDMRRKIRDIVIAVVIRIIERDRNDLVVPVTLIEHTNDADRITANQRHGKERLGAEHQHIQRVIVVRIGTRDQPVIRGIMRRGVQDAVELDQTGLLVQLIFIFASLGDFHDRDEVVRRNAFGVNFVPDIHKINLPSKMT